MCCNHSATMGEMGSFMLAGFNPACGIAYCCVSVLNKKKKDHCELRDPIGIGLPTKINVMKCNCWTFPDCRLFAKQFRATRSQTKLKERRLDKFLYYSSFSCWLKAPCIAALMALVSEFYLVCLQQTLFYQEPPRQTPLAKPARTIWSVATRFPSRTVLWNWPVAEGPPSTN